MCVFVCVCMGVCVCVKRLNKFIFCMCKMLPYTERKIFNYEFLEAEFLIMNWQSQVI